MMNAYSAKAPITDLTDKYDLVIQLASIYTMQLEQLKE